MQIEGRTLTTCGITPDGQAIHLDLLDVAGNPASLKLPVEQIAALAMTLPTLLQKALQTRFRDHTLKYAYPLSSWSLERSSDPSTLMITLKTPDGFSVVFALGRGECEALASTLARQPETIPAPVRN